MTVSPFPASGGSLPQIVPFVPTSGLNGQLAAGKYIICRAASAITVGTVVSVNSVGMSNELFVSPCNGGPEQNAQSQFLGITLTDIAPGDTQDLVAVAISGIISVQVISDGSSDLGNIGQVVIQSGTAGQATIPTSVSSNVTRIGILLEPMQTPTDGYCKIYIGGGHESF